MPSIDPSRPAGHEAAPLFCLPVRIAELTPLDRDLTEGTEPGSSRIVLVWGGGGQLQLQEQPYEAARGFALLAGGSVPSLHVTVVPPSSLRGIVIEYKYYYAGGRPAEGPSGFRLLQRCSDHSLRLSADLYGAWKEPVEAEPLQVQWLFSQLLSKLHREAADLARSSGGWLEEAVAFIETHYRDDLTREQMAEMARVSPEHFSRAFRKHTGRTFNDYLTMQRIRRAQISLLTDTDDMNTIADKVGYKEGLYLSRKFKSVVGLSPTAYRRQRRRIAALNLNHTAALVALGRIPELGVYTSWTMREKNRRYGKDGAALDPYGHTPDSLYKAIAEVGPDVIVHYSGAWENAALLPLAPVIGLPFRTMSWRVQFRVIADTVNQSREAERWLSRYDERAGRVYEALDQRLAGRGTAIVWELAGTKAFGCGESHGRGAQVLYGDLGFQPPDALREQRTAGYVEAPIEAIPSYPADHIFITGIPACPLARRCLGRLFRSPDWLGLEAVRSGRVYIMQDSHLFCGYDPISTLEQLNVIARKLLADHNFA